MLYSRPSVIDDLFALELCPCFVTNGVNIYGRIIFALMMHFDDEYIRKDHIRFDDAL